MRRATGLASVLLPIVVLVAVGTQTPVAQTPGGDPNAPGIDMNGPYDPVPNWYKPIHPGTLQCGSGVAAESANRVYVVTEVEVPEGHQGACTPERYKSGAHSHNIIVLDSTGKVIEDWKQWDQLFGYGHAVPYCCGSSTEAYAASFIILASTLPVLTTSVNATAAFSHSSVCSRGFFSASARDQISSAQKYWVCA